MDRSLDDSISERRGPPRGRRGGRYDDRRGATDSYRKPRDETRDPEDEHWVHDKFEGDRFTRRDNRAPANGRLDRYDPQNNRSAEQSAKLRIDNLHYDLTEEDLRGLFATQGPITRLEIIYDRSDRSTGQAYVTYESARDADYAIREYDGARAMGQRLKVTRVPTGPSGAARGRGLAARIDGPASGASRSLFDRIDRRRSESPRRSDGRSAPDRVDRYVPRDRPDSRRRSPRPRSPARRGGLLRGARRGRGAPRTDPEGRPMVGGRPRKTADDLDAEMADYWGGKEEAGKDATATTTVQTAGNGAPSNEPAATAATNVALDDDIDMIE